MKYAIVSSSAITKYGRMDAGFHIAANELKGQADKLEERFLAGADAEPQDKRAFLAARAAELLEGTRLDLLRPLLVLARGQDPKHEKATYDRVIKEYPMLSLALLEQNMASAVEEVQAGIERDRGYLDRLLGITQQLAPEQESYDPDSGPTP